MKRRTLLAGSAALAATATPLVASIPAEAAGPTKIVLWHAMTALLADSLNTLCTRFNAAQTAYVVTPVYKGGYPDVMTATIAAFRAGQAPHIAQIFEVGTGSMLAAGKAIKEVWQLSKETGVKLDPKNYIPSVRGYYGLADGRMAGMPFNSSTAVMWYSKDAFEKAGLDPEKPPATWPEVVAAARAIKEKNAADIPMITSWPSWIQFEQYSALHNIPFASEADGFDGLGAKLEVNSKAHVKHVQRLLDMSKEGTFKYAGRDNIPDPLLVGGKAGIAFNSSGMRGDLTKSAKFKWGEAYLPYDPAIIKTPLNSIIGGAALWSMTAPHRTEAEYKGVAEFFAFLAQPQNDAFWHQKTGYVPVTLAGFAESQKDGFYKANPGADLPVKQLERGHVTKYSRGLRLGRLPEIRNIIEEELEKALQGQQNAQTAMDNAVERSNKVLRAFQRAVKA
ncbi:MAG: sn-glycerol-3-phosphate ABC transporter substrate-binding protein UgpB [Rhodospirillales bacterium]|nr:sn-glycerol-3-phosphate ABC transporter substrate-binding protein UgpB [Rhodospirillales bacterium]